MEFAFGCAFALKILLIFTAPQHLRFFADGGVVKNATPTGAWCFWEIVAMQLHDGKAAVGGAFYWRT